MGRNLQLGLGLGSGPGLGIRHGVVGKGESGPVTWSWGKARVGAGPGSLGLVSKFGQVVKTRYLNPPK